jgi:hypothetical protein
MQQFQQQQSNPVMQTQFGGSQPANSTFNSSFNFNHSLPNSNHLNLAHHLPHHHHHHHHHQSAYLHNTSTSPTSHNHAAAAAAVAAAQYGLSMHIRKIECVD